MENFELTPEILSKASECETAEEILTKAKEYGKDITIEQAQRVFDMSHASGAVSDEDLESATGGTAGTIAPSLHCPYCNCIITGRYNKMIVTHIKQAHPEKYEEFMERMPKNYK